MGCGGAEKLTERNGSARRKLMKLMQIGVSVFMQQYAVCVIEDAQGHPGKRSF